MGKSETSRIELRHEEYFSAGDVIPLRNFKFDDNMFRVLIKGNEYRGGLSLVRAEVKNPLSMLYIYALFHMFIQVRLLKLGGKPYLELSDSYDLEGASIASFVRIPYKFSGEVSDDGTIAYVDEDHFVISFSNKDLGPIHLYAEGDNILVTEQN